MSPTKESMTREEYNAYMRDYRKKMKADLRSHAEEEFQKTIVRSVLELENQGLRTIISLMQMPQFTSKAYEERDKLVKNSLDLLKLHTQGAVRDFCRKRDELIAESETAVDAFMDQEEAKWFEKLTGSPSISEALPGVKLEPEVKSDWKGYVKTLSALAKDRTNGIV